MMPGSQRFQYTAADPALGQASLLPLLPPYQLGLSLGANWERQENPVYLTGNLARFEAKTLVVSATVGSLSPVRLAFAWTRAEDVPLILGQVNFFMAFDVCFYRTQGFFEVKSSSQGAVKR